MKRIARSGLVMAALMLFSAVGGPAAHAVDLAGGAAQGSGTIVPALTTIPTNTTVGFDGTAVGTFENTGPTVVPGVCNIHFVGNGVGETDLSGNGGGNLTCNGTSVLGQAIAETCAVTYARTVVVVIVSGTCTGNAGGNLHAACVFEPTSVPAGSYLLECTFIIDPV